MSQVVITALYHFVVLDNYQEIRQPLLSLMLKHNIKGTLLLAKEGINGTVASSEASRDILLNWLKEDPRLSDLRYKCSYDSEMPFYRSRVKLKKEIVTMGVQGIDPNQVVGTYVNPEDWNALISDPDVMVIDTRNQYETSIGSFKHAQDPKTETFREFPSYVKDNLNPTKNKKIAMFCTGGIRCEKSTAYLKEQGFDEVYHLKGGILKYLETVPKEESLWQGECFVFDNRVSVNHDLEKGSYDQCFACRLPITDEDKQSPKYEHGISCPHCFDTLSEEQIKRFKQREKQSQLAKSRGQEHMGSAAIKARAQNRQAKIDIKEQQRKTR